MAYFYMDPRGQMTTAPPGRQRQIGGGFGMNQSQAQGQYNVDVPDLQELQKKYMQGQPDVSPAKQTEAMLGRFRSEMQPAMERGILGAQTHAARTGQSYADTAGRALGQAVGGMAPAAGDVVSAGQQIGTQAQLAQRAQADKMASLDATMQMQSQQFMKQIEAEFQMLDRQLRTQERIAMQGARSQEEVARIQQRGQMQRTQFITQAQQKATQFQQEQENWRHAQQLKFLSGAEAGRQGIARDRLSLDIGVEKRRQPPGTQPGGEQPPPPQGSGWIDFGGKKYNYGGAESGFQPEQPAGSAYPGAQGWSNWNQFNQPAGRPGTTQLNKWNTEWWR